MTRRLREQLHRIREYDRGLLLSVGVLCIVGVVMVYDAGSFRSEARTSTTYLFKHVVRLLLGALALIGAARFDYNKLRNGWLRLALLIVGAGLVVMTVVLAATGLVGARYGAGRWFLFVQPVEIAKIALIVFLAHELAGGWDRLARDPRRLARVLAVPAVTVLALVLQPNFGNAIVISLLTILILTLSGIPGRWLAVIAGGGVSVAILCFFFIPRVHHRLVIWWSGLQGDDLTYQVWQGIIGIVAGGVFGQGFGSSHQRLAFLPDAHTDFIFAVLGEEAGLIGSLILVFMYVIFATRGFKIAREAGDGFGSLLAAGLTSMIVIYALINLGMVTSLLPVMGLPLPFVSYGGSALITNLAAVGILLNIDMQRRDIQARLQRMRRP